MTWLILGHVAQWAVTLGMAIALLALYRHEGAKLLSSQAERFDQGPPTGEDSRITGRLPGPAGASPALPQLVAFLDTRCKACMSLLADLSQAGEDRLLEASSVVVLSGERAKFESIHRILGPNAAVVEDPKGAIAREARIFAHPYFLVLAPNGVVLGKGSPRSQVGIRRLVQAAQLSQGMATEA